MKEQTNYATHLGAIYAEQYHLFLYFDSNNSRPIALYLRFHLSVFGVLDQRNQTILPHRIGAIRRNTPTRKIGEISPNRAYQVQVLFILQQRFDSISPVLSL